MLRISTYVSSLVDRGFRRIKLLINGSVDVQPTYQSMPFGIDGVPPNNWRAIYSSTGEKGRNVIVGYINQNQLSALNAGENYVYSTNDAGDKVEAFIKFLNDGRLQLLGSGDFLVRFNALETGFNQLRSDFNSHLTNYNGHIHLTTATVGATATPGLISATTSTSTPSTADISGSKIDDIETL